MFKQILKTQIPTLKKDLNLTIENILNDVANEEELNPFELSLTLSKEDEKAIGKVFDEELQCIHQLDAGLLIEELFKKQLEVIPAMFKDWVLEKLGGENVNDMVLDLLKEESILIRYDKTYKLEYLKINAGNIHPIDMDDFFNNLEF